MKAYSAGNIFTGREWITDHSVVVVHGVIESVLPTSALPSEFEVVDVGAHSIIPAFIDVQIYGAGGKLLSMHPNAGALQALYDYCVEGGAHHFLPTVATNTYEVFFEAIDAVRSYWQSGGKGVIGLHIEGPWMNEVKRGAHIKELIHSPTTEQATTLLKYGKGVIKMITLAPEVCSEEVIKLVQSYGVIVSAGHSNATFAQATKAFNNGVTVATHLYNAMSPLQHRQPGMVGAIMHHPTVMASIIADGHHIDFEAVAIAKRVMGERLFMITDAVTETQQGPYPHQKAGDKYEANGILSGSALTMLQGVKNCVEKIGIDTKEAIRMASLYPSKVLGMQNELGCIAKGYKANLLVVNEQLDILQHIGL